MKDGGKGRMRSRRRKKQTKRSHAKCFFPPTFLKAPECNFRQVSEQLSTASPHNNKSDRNKGGRVAHCDGLPFTSKFQVYVDFDSVLK